MVNMRFVTKSHLRAAAFVACAAASMFAFGRPALADNPADEEVVDSDDDADDPVSDTTVDGGYADTDPSAVTAFRSDLAPYGSWEDDPRYGTVWVPNSNVVGADFTPYQTAGHWDLAGDGDWMWASDYEWGYIPFHYGRWVWTDTGWAWIPGRAYADAWVTWRVGYDGYIGWAAMPPAYYWWNGGVVVLGRSPYASYGFCNTHDVFSHHLQQHMIRDKAEVQRAGASTHPYAGSGRSYTPASPTLEQAHISPGSAPQYAHPEPRSQRLSKPPAGARSVPAPSAGRSDRGGAPSAISAADRSTVGHGASERSAGETTHAAARPQERTQSRSEGARGEGSGEGARTEGRSTERASGFEARSGERTEAPRRLDTSRTLSSEPRASRTDVRSLDEVHVVRRPSSVSNETRTIPSSRGSFDRGSEPQRSYEPQRSSSEPRGGSFESRPAQPSRSPSFESRSYSAPHYSPSYSHSAPSSAPAPHRSSAPAPSFHGGGGGGGRSGGGGHHR